ncbi:helix-turn-helix transcriptional regulator [Bradyrhizobium sp. BRP14]|nr:helix-turn-helix transcriptional regulator [Bradyrhizobium sp. BRP14]
MKPIQLKMARAAVGLGVRELAELAGVTANTITRIENGADAKQSTLDALRAVLEKDVIFLSDGETTSGGVGVRLRSIDRP